MSRELNRFINREMQKESKRVVRSKPIQKLMITKENIDKFSIFQKVVYYTKVISNLINKEDLICGNSISFLQNYEHIDFLDKMNEISNSSAEDHAKAMDCILSSSILANEGGANDLWYLNFCATIAYVFVISGEYKLLPLANYEDAFLFAAINGNLVDQNMPTLSLQNKYKLQKLWNDDDFSYSKTLIEFGMTDIGCLAQDNYLTSITLFNSVMMKHRGVITLTNIKKEVKEFGNFQKLAKLYLDKCVILEEKLAKVNEDNEERVDSIVKKNKDLINENSNLVVRNRELEFEILRANNRLNVLEDKLKLAESLLPEEDYKKVEEEETIYDQTQEEDVDLSKAVLVIDYNAENFKGWLPTYSYKGSKNDLKRLNKYNLVIFVTSEMSHKYFWAVRDYCDKMGIDYIFVNSMLACFDQLDFHL